jgi:hypothetical protein
MNNSVSNSDVISSSTKDTNPNATNDGIVAMDVTSTAVTVVVEDHHHQYQYPLSIPTEPLVPAAAPTINTNLPIDTPTVLPVPPVLPNDTTNITIATTNLSPPLPPSVAATVAVDDTTRVVPTTDITATAATATTTTTTTTTTTADHTNQMTDPNVGGPTNHDDTTNNDTDEPNAKRQRIDR